MNAWMQRVFCVGGMILATGFGATGIGCQQGTYAVKVQLTPMGMWVELHYSPLDDSENYDLDGLPYEWVDHDGKSYRFYPSKGWLYDPETGQLYQLDDRSWQELLQLVHSVSASELPLLSTPTKAVTRTTMGLITSQYSMGSMGVGVQADYISISLSLLGDTQLPVWDVDRWATLDRVLFVFPDGVSGSPDPMRLQVTGDVSDVFGYLAELGVTQCGLTIDDEEWSLMIDDDLQLADIYFGESLFTTILLN